MTTGDESTVAENYQVVQLSERIALLLLKYYNIYLQPGRLVLKKTVVVVVVIVAVVVVAVIVDVVVVGGAVVVGWCCCCCWCCCCRCNYYNCYLIFLLLLLLFIFIMESFGIVMLVKVINLRGQAETRGSAKG